MKLYCQQCGNGMTYASSKPKFCSQCGSPISIYSKQKESKNENYEFDESLNIEEDPADLNIGNMTSLDVDIDPFGIPKQTIGGMLESKSKGEIPFKMDKFESPNETVQSDEEFMESFKKEAGTDRQK